MGAFTLTTLPVRRVRVNDKTWPASDKGIVWRLARHKRKTPTDFNAERNSTQDPAQPSSLSRTREFLICRAASNIK